MKNEVINRWDGITDQYNAFRPEAPEKLIDILLRLSQKSKPELVVDLGCGPGNSTRAWRDKTHRIIGIEPSKEMISKARELTNFENIDYIQAFAHETTLPDHCADLVVASSSIHWMEPASTQKEIRRIVKKDGLFSYWSPSYPPVTPFMELDQAYFNLAQKIKENVKT
jgi:ubiquinone/menaquinone biosynthesis C-methylase UbiE